MPKKPLEIRPVLFMDFANLDGSAESCLGFANKWGYLGLGLFPSDDQSPYGGEALDQWQERIQSMREAIEVWKDNPEILLVGGRNEFFVSEMRAVLVQSPPDGSLEMRVRPSSLYSAMRLQFGGAVASGSFVRTCDQCGQWFGAGGSGRRMDARFCSNKCRADYHNAKKRKAS